MVGLSPPLSGLLQDEPTAAYMSRLGFVAGAVGNHEFDEGPDELVRLVDGESHPTTISPTGSFPGLTFPCLAANVVSERTGYPILPAIRVLSVRGVHVGVVGVASSDAARQHGANTSGLRCVDAAAAVNRGVAELREHQVAAIIVLTYLGGVATANGSVLGGSPSGFAAALDPDVDVIVAGPTRKPAEAGQSGILTAQAHPHGLSYGAVDLWIDRRLNRMVERATDIYPSTMRSNPTGRRPRCWRPMNSTPLRLRTPSSESVHRRQFANRLPLRPIPATAWAATSEKYPEPRPESTSPSSTHWS